MLPLSRILCHYLPPSFPFHEYSAISSSSITPTAIQHPTHPAYLSRSSASPSPRQDPTDTFFRPPICHKLTTDLPQTSSDHRFRGFPTPNPSGLPFPILCLSLSTARPNRHLLQTTDLPQTSSDHRFRGFPIVFN